MIGETYRLPTVVLSTGSLNDDLMVLASHNPVVKSVVARGPGAWP